MPIDIRPGQRYRVTLLQDSTARDEDTFGVTAPHGPYIGARPGFTHGDDPKHVTPAGTSYEGYACAADGAYFELALTNGTTIGFYVDDPGIRIEGLVRKA
jgi:hypothetical protein